MRGTRFLAISALSILLLAGAACTGNAETGLDTADEASSLAAQIELQQAGSVVGNYFATGGTYDGFDAAEGESFEPQIKWEDGGPAATGVVSVRGLSATTVVLVTADESGNPLCLGQTSGMDSMGTQDAQNASECTGGW